MKITRIYGLVLRHLFYLRRSFDRLSDIFYWPVLDLIIWGLTGYYFLSLAPNSEVYIKAIIGGILLWIIPWRAQSDVSLNVLTELWDRNLSNIFAAPLGLYEWIVSMLFVGILKSLFSFFFASFIGFLLYKVDITIYGYYLIPLFFVLFLFGWTIGFLVSSVCLRFGSRIQTLAWSVPWAVAPFSVIYFPSSILPQWGQSIAHLLPSSYIFELGRQIIFQQTFNWNQYLIGLTLGILYFTISIVIFRWSFKKTINRGLQSVS